MVIYRLGANKLQHLADTAGMMLRYGGKLMQCIDDMQREAEQQSGDMGERRYMSEGGMYGNRYDGGMYGNRQEWDDMGERRGVAGSGRGYRY